MKYELKYHSVAYAEALQTPNGTIADAFIQSVPTVNYTQRVE